MTLNAKSVAASVALVVCLVAPSSAKNSHDGLVGTITGRVLDADTGSPLAGVNVLVEGTTRGAISDAVGIFTVPRVGSGTYTVRFSTIGYARLRLPNVVVTDGSITDLGVIRLSVESIRLDEIVVTPGQFSIMGGASVSQQVLTADDIKNMSWAEDVTRAVARLPGISSSDYSSKFTVRGGESDEVLISLDGMELYEPFHQRDYSGGLFSIVDIETIQGIELMTGGFSSAYGERLSGVFNMRTKRIEPGERHASVGLSVMNARAYADGSFGDGKGSYIFSVRRGMLDVLFSAAPGIEATTLDQSAIPSFYDAMAKVSYAIGPKHTLSIYALHAGDRTTIDDVSEDGSFDKNETSYRNTYGWLSLNSIFSPNVFARTILYSGLIHHDRNGSFQKYEPSDKGNFQLTDVRDYSLFGIKQDWNWNSSDNPLFSAGFEAKQVRTKYDYFSHIEEVRVDSTELPYDFELSRDIEFTPSGQQVGAYVSGRFKLLPRLVAEAGGRFDHASYSGDSNWSPRLGLAYAFSSSTVLRAAWGYYYQSQVINNLDINHGNTAFDPAELAKHYVVGFQHTFGNGVELRVEGYRKDLEQYSPAWQNLRDHLEIFPEARGDNALVVLNGATAQGAELFMKYDRGGKLSWWVSYGLAKAEDDVRSIDFDGFLVKRTGTVPRLNNQRHTIFVDVNYRPSRKWHINVSWQYYKGWPRTTYTYRYLTLDNGDLHFYAVHDVFNGVEYPAYHRMDVRANRHFATRSGTITAFVHLINVYNRENLKKFDLDTRDDAGNFSIDESGNYVPFRDDAYWFGFIPTVGASWEF